MKFHEYIPYGLGVMSQARRKHYTTPILGKEELIKKLN